MGFALARLGRREEAQQVLAGLLSPAATQPVAALPIAFVRQGMGDIDGALEWYGRAIDAHEGLVAMLGVELVLDELRPDPRCSALVERLRLPG